jgi:hypothetical protein
MIAAALAFTACDGDKADGDTGVAAAFEPAPGDWSWNGTTYDLDECNLADAFPASVIDVTMWNLVVVNDGYELDNEIWTADPINCTLTDMDFSCSIEIIIDEEAWPDGSMNEGDPEATYTAAGLITGSFTDTQTGSVSLTTDITCEGADCDAYGAESGLLAPCTTTLSGGFARS